MSDLAQAQPVESKTRPYKGSCVPLWFAFLASLGALIGEWYITASITNIWTVGFLVMTAITGSFLFIVIISLANYSPMVIYVTQNALRIDYEGHQEIVRFADILEIQRSEGFFQDEVILTARHDRTFNLENLVEADRIVDAIVRNASIAAPKARGAKFKVIRSRGKLQMSEAVGRRVSGENSYVVELTNTFPVFLASLPLTALFPSLLTAVIVFLGVVAFNIAPMTPATAGMSALICLSLYLAIGYTLFVERQIRIDRDEIVVETSNDQRQIKKGAIKRVSSSRAGFARRIDIEMHDGNNIKLWGFPNPEGIEGAIRWAITPANTEGPLTEPTAKAAGSRDHTFFRGFFRDN